MISKQKLEEDFKAFCEQQGLKMPRVEVQEYDIDNEFFQKNEHVWDAINYDNPNWEENQEELEIDYTGWFKNDHPVTPDDFPITQELYEYMSENGYISFEDKWVDNADVGTILRSLEDKTFKDLSVDMQTELNEFWKDLEFSDIEEEDFLKEAIEEALGITYLEDEYSSSKFMEIMAYWLVYFSPRREDWGAAWKSGLYPFKYEGEFMVALGGCGMDLSPKLDCYQALTYKSLPSRSTVFNDVSYFSYVSPVKHGEILKMCKLKEPKIIFTAYGQEEKPEEAREN
jgi:hypothetical protein